MKIGLAILPVWTRETPPLGPAYLKSALVQDGHQVKIHDFNIECSREFEDRSDSLWSQSDLLLYHDDYDYFQEKILPKLRSFLGRALKKLISENYEAVGFSIYQGNLLVSLHLMGLLKKIDPNIKIFIGGPGITSYEELIQEGLKTGLIDSVVIGEGEDSVVKVVKSWESKIESLPKDIGPLPIPLLDDYDFNLYQRPQIPIALSRGCPYACAFCFETVFWKKFRTRKLEGVIEEIKTQIERYQMKDFYFCDSLLNGDHKFLESFVDRVLEEKIDFSWWGFVKADKRLTSDLILKMKQAGCKTLLIGVESASQRVLDLMNKKAQISEIERVIKDARVHKIDVHPLFIVGFPGETEEDFQKTIDFIEKFKHDFYKVTIGYGLRVAPLSNLSLNPEKYNLVTDPDGEVIFDENREWKNLDGSNTPQIRQDRLERIRDFLDKSGIPWL